MLQITVINNKRTDIWLCNTRFAPGYTVWPAEQFLHGELELLRAYPGLTVIDGDIAAPADVMTAIDRAADLLALHLPQSPPEIAATLRSLFQPAPPLAPAEDQPQPQPQPQPSKRRR